ncbi:MAG: (4Fe-4S)-binding protein [Bacteroidetes bacterium]|nr:(4Fe-4S)-binding protein [Bacteroidota bacterium]
MQEERPNREMRYSNGDITIVWKPWLCIHSTRCWKELPAVFHPLQRPWITPMSANTEEIIQQVSQCPSGALSIEKSK